MSYPFWIAQGNLNSPQETDSPPDRLAATMLQVNTMTAASPKQILVNRYFLRTAALVLLVLWILLSVNHPVRAQVPVRLPAPRTTMIVFADQHMQDDQWTALFAALRKDHASFAVATPAIAGEVELMHGDEVKPGLQVINAITVFLRGDCTLMPRPRQVVLGALGWVPRGKTGIAPFINVDCSRLVEMLGPMALSMNHSVRINVMAEAMTRVIMHEWIHIATQSAKHSARGVMRDQFGVADLLADTTGLQGKRRNRKASKKRRA